MTVFGGSLMRKASENTLAASPQRLQAALVLWRYGRDKSQADLGKS
jgi:hypothetical protein